MIAGEVVTAVLAIGFLVWIAGCAAGAPLTKAARIFAAAALMAATIDFARIQIGSIDSPFLELAAIVLCGALLYLLLLLAICQSCLKGPMPHRE